MSVPLRPRLLTWGANAGEARAALPGDDVVAARWQATRAVPVAAPARQVWLWLVQMGYGRGGWYSNDRLERLVGAGRFTDGGSARRVIPELQHLAVGDAVPRSEAGGLTVAVCEPGSALVLHLRRLLRTVARRRCPSTLPPPSPADEPDRRTSPDLPTPLFEGRDRRL